MKLISLLLATPEGDELGRLQLETISKRLAVGNGGTKGGHRPA